MTDIRTSVETPPQDRPARSLDGGTIAAGTILVVLGGLWLLDVLDIVQIRASIAIPALLAGVGLALMAASLRGSHPGLVTLGVFLTVATFFSAVAPVEALRGGLGERATVVERAGDLRSPGRPRTGT